MQGRSKSGTEHPSARLLALATAGALIVSGCVSPAFREAVGRFGAATKAVAAAQREQLAAVTAEEQAELRSALVAEGAVLELTDACTTALLSTDVQPSLPVGEPPQCALVRHGSDNVLRARQYRNMIALDNALSAYADNLIALAADNAKEREAFSSALTSLATSVGNLNNAIRQASGLEEADLTPRLSAITNLIGELGNLYFAHERNRVLRRVVREGEPIIQRAIVVLEQAAGAIARSRRSSLRLDDLLQNANNVALGRENPARLRAAQDQVFSAVNSFNLVGPNARLFGEMRTAHQKLVVAANQGASAADIRAAIEAISHLATTAHDTLTELGIIRRNENNAN